MLNRSCRLMPAVVIALALLGCRNEAGKAPASRPASAPASRDSADVLPELPGQDEPQAGMEILVTHPRLDRAADSDAYRSDPNVPSGNLVVVTRWSRSVGDWRQLPKPPAVDVENGPYAVAEPQPGEVSYYKNCRLTQPAVYALDDRARGAPANVLVMLRGIRSGKARPLRPGLFSVANGKAQAMYLLAPPGERVFCGTWDTFACQVELHAGLFSPDGPASAPAGSRRLFSGTMIYEHKLADDLKAGDRIPTPKTIQTDVIADLGIHTIGCARHPWQRSYVIVLDNPYATVVTGSATLLDVPVGKWTLEVWHPTLKPVKATLPVEITQHKTTEIAVVLDPPR